MQTNSEFKFKMFVIGNLPVGKTQIVERFTKGNFKDNYTSTMGVEIYKKEVTINTNTFKLELWDTVGHGMFKTMITPYYKVIDGVMIVYDITDRQSFTDIANWLADVKTLAKKNVAIILIGNKSDLTDKREVSFDEAKQFADSLNIKLIETSAKESLNIDAAFMTLLEEIRIKC